MKDRQKTKPQIQTELEALREELRRHIAAESDAERAEESMWQTQIALIELFNNLPGMAYRTAFDNDHPRGHVEFVSAGCLTLTGYPAADYISDPTLYRAKVVHAADRERVMAAIAEAQAHRQAHRVTYRIVTREGELRWMDEHGTSMFGPTGELVAREGFIMDVTERMVHIEELRQRHTELQRLTRALEQAGELIVIGDASGAVRYVNQAFERLTGYVREEIIGHPLSGAVGAPQERDLLHRIRVALRGGEIWRGRYVTRRKDGTPLELDCTVSPVFSPERHYDGYVAVQRDSGGG